MAEDRLTAYLAGVRGDIGALEALVTRLTTFAVPVAEFNAAQDRLAGHTPRLLATVERLLKLADDWDAKAREIGEQVTLQDCDGAVAGFKMIGHQNHRDHAKALREAISAELLEGEPGA